MTFIGSFPQANPYSMPSPFAPVAQGFQQTAFQANFSMQADYFSSVLGAQQNLLAGWTGFSGAVPSSGSMFPAPTFGQMASANSASTSHFINPGFSNQFINPGFRNPTGNGSSFAGVQLGNLNAFNGLGGSFGSSIFPTPTFGFNASANSLGSSHFTNPGFNQAFFNPGFMNPLGNFGTALSHPGFTAFNSPAFGQGGGHPGFVNVGGPPHLHTTLPLPPMFTIGVI